MNWRKKGYLPTTIITHYLPSRALVPLEAMPISGYPSVEGLLFILTRHATQERSQGKLLCAVDSNHKGPVGYSILPSHPINLFFNKSVSIPILFPLSLIGFVWALG
ncbi:hypothetical protein FRC14_000644 [Serendipita sp. 396]|nr:hypothetical protein FRC14_000644 [Serendipita sp. 396]KAG8775143.1 hypothetical protein FRC15_000748 [Serendipita sp. 397]KAG8791856.1 hypothetical protein FRC16_000246 [Serendipita sp. 398]KAG8799315.1 hypothetical protein FRC18_008330 [Serendipita sp. 400]KAG8856733.1 hypothetical protein FRB91_000366 [Serendipita sp. 411]KAG9047242.1 hypothetical protein FS842_000696 [Serendipita sp. 407]